MARFTREGGGFAESGGGCWGRGPDVSLFIRCRLWSVLLFRAGSVISNESLPPEFIDTGEGSWRNQAQDLGMAFADSHQVGFVLRPLAGTARGVGRGPELSLNHIR